MELLKLLNLSEIVAQIACFLLVLGLLRVFAWKRILGMLDARKERIASEFKKIEDIRQEVERSRKEYQEKLEHIEELSRARITEAVNEANRVAREIRINSQEESKKIIDNAQEHIRLETRKAKEDLKESVVILAMEAAEKIIRDKISKDEEKKIISDFLLEMEKMP
ncbi:MAG: F0F1 ATP synthase subunit B [Candidatus Omnitrophica bacterium]|nr:F0F1 ATP synthase subunit B [Candidatus Omnitrophota bacterium]